MALCQFSATSSVLRPLALWCLDSFGDGPPMLIGVVLDPDAVRMHPVELDDRSPLDDLQTMIAPPDWDALVIVATAGTVGSSSIDTGVLAHAVDRHAMSATVLDDSCGHRRTLRTLRGQLHRACVDMFEIDLGPSWTRH